jgi:hypothetical protein
MRSALLSLAFLSVSLSTAFADAPASPYAKWTHGFPTDPNFFPLAVWLQSSRHAADYAKAGINTYVALSDDVSDQSLAALKAAGMKLVLEQNPATLKYIDDPTIVAWMHGDEPDNAQDLPNHNGYGPPILPQKIVDEYNAMVKADPTRPVMLNLGMAVAMNEWFGRGVRTGHAEDYPEYIKGADLVSFDIYPVASDDPKLQGKLEYVPKGVDHLVQISQGQKVVFNCLECTHIGSKNIATPHQVRAEAWLALIHGSHGIIYFVHQFTPNFVEADLLQEPEMLAAVTALNKEITSLAPELNSPDVPNGAQVQVDNAQAPVDIAVKSNGSATYLFTAERQNQAAKATFTLPGLKGTSTVTVINENRTIPAQDGVFTDSFGPWDVHLYQVIN